MKLFGIWILLSFALYYVFALMTGNKHTFGCLTVGTVLAGGIVLAFLT